MHIYGKNSIAIVQNKNNIVYGRYTIATRFIPAGTIINIESPIVTYKRNKPIKINYTDEQKQLIQNLWPVNDPSLDEKCRKNSFYISNNEDAVFYKSSMINHSCEPNIYYNTIFGNLFMITRKNIFKGDELTISYIDSWKYGLIERQIILDKIWNFTCTCIKCIKEKNDFNK